MKECSGISMRFNVKLNAMRNIFFGIINKILLMVLPFVVKSIINYYLGAEYLGLSSLFSSILQVLLLSELGFSSALVYHMYRPIAENDQKMINALLNLYKKAYQIIGLIIMFVGLAIALLLPHLIKGECPEDVNITIVYVIQLANTVISYFLFGYKQSLLTAYQREDVNSIINLVVQAGLQLVQILLLVFTKNYYLYIACMPVFTVINNVWIGLITKKMYPEAICYGKLDNNTLSDIKKLVAGTFIQKACATTRNSLDSICISSFIGLTLTGIYNNYYTILSGLTLMLGIIGTSLSGGVGNHVAIKSKSENFEELSKLDFLYMNISSWATVCLLCIYQPFMKLWMGEDMQLPFGVVVLLCIYFYLLKMGDMRSLYSSANGLWWKMRYRSIFETICNVGLNIGLGLAFGIYGIIMATIISIFVCNFLWSSLILFAEYFGKSKMIKYFVYQAKYALSTILICCVSYFVCNCVKSNSMLLVILLRGTISTAIFIGFFMVLYGKNRTFKESLAMIKK